jgi:lysophospholipase L1-like esterase
MFAEQGADSRDFADQAQQAVDNQVDYVTVFLGHNDVCQNDLDYIYDIETFRNNMKAGLDVLAGINGEEPRLLPGAVIYIVGIVNIQQLREAAKDKKALGIIDCEVLWALSLLDLYPCASILKPDGPIEAAVDHNEDINDILSDLAYEYNRDDPNHYYYYTDAIDILSSPVEEPFPEYYVSDIDCFHPSAEGQRVIAAETWDINLFLPPSP